MPKKEKIVKTAYDKMLDEAGLEFPQLGDIVKGIVVAAGKSEVKIDINGIATGVVRGRELYSEADEYAKLKIGDEVEATVIDAENEHNELELSFRRAGQEKAWLTLAEAYRNKTNIKIKVMDANRGGLIAGYFQVQGFLPVSQLSPENYPRVSGGDKTKILEKLKSLVGRDLEVKVINLDVKDEKLVVSEKDAWQETKRDLLDKVKIGDKVTGTISAITNFGVFVSFGENLEGLIHISELAWQRIDDPADIYKVGDKIESEIISIEGAKIFLSAKKLLEDPWQKVAERYQIGQRVSGTVLKINPFGLFVELDKDIHGLAHVSQLNLASGQKLSNFYNVGDQKEFIIATIEAKEHRLGLEIPGEDKKKIVGEEIVEMKGDVEVGEAE